MLLLFLMFLWQHKKNVLQKTQEPKLIQEPTNIYPQTNT